MKAIIAEDALADYEALIYRAQAAADYDDQSGLDRNVLRQSLAMLLDDDINRINRIQARLAHRLAGRQDLAAQLSHLAETGMARILARPKAVEITEPDTPVDHTTDEAVATARMLFPILSLRAMQQIEERIIDRPRHDKTWADYVDALLNLHDQTLSCQRRLDDNPLPAKRMAQLGACHLRQQSDQARQLSAKIAGRYHGQTRWRSTGWKEGYEQLRRQLLPSEAETELPNRTLSPAEMQTICRAANTAINAMIELIDRWAAAERWDAVHSGTMVARQYGKPTLDKAGEPAQAPFDEDAPEEVVDTKAAAAELEQTMQPIRASAKGLLTAENWIESQADAHRCHAAAAALHGHTAALTALMSRIAAHRDDDAGTSIAAAVWVNENVIRRALDLEPPGDAESPAIWAAARAALEELDAAETTAAQVVAALRPRRLSPALRSPLMAEEVAEVTRDSRYRVAGDTHVNQMDDTPPEEWILEYQYQGALHAKLLGEPYDHDIAYLVVLEHMEYVERLACGYTTWMEPEFRNDLREIAARTRELAASGLQSTPDALFRMAISHVFELTERTHAVHAVIDALTGNRPTASNYLKNVYHPGPQFLDPDRCAIIVVAARGAGVPSPGVTELCHRLGLPEEAMDEMGVAQRYRAPEALALDAVNMIDRLDGRLDHDAAKEAACQLGWDEELVYKAGAPRPVISRLLNKPTTSRS